MWTSIMRSWMTVQIRADFDVRRPSCEGPPLSLLQLKNTTMALRSPQNSIGTAVMPNSYLHHLTLSAACGLLCACAANTQSPVSAPGNPESARTKALEAGAAVLQSKPPLDALNAYLDGFHFYNGHPQAQMEAHHFKISACRSACPN
jgi:hypothetical protein